MFFNGISVFITVFELLMKRWLYFAIPRIFSDTYCETSGCYFQSSRKNPVRFMSSTKLLS